MKRLRNAFTIVSFVFWSLVLLCQERQVHVTWTRNKKQLILLIDVYNHLDEK